MPKFIQRARRLLAVLIVALRDHGAFNPEIVRKHGETHFPGDFKPWVHSLRETYRLYARLSHLIEDPGLQLTQSRLAYNILKVDVGISVFLNQAPLLGPEELELSIPSTWALNNAHGIDRFFERLPNEPQDREMYPMLALATDFHVTVKSGFLFQDIQLGLLGLFGEIFRWVQMRRLRDAGVTANGCRDLELSAQLETWHTHLESICGLWRDPILNAEQIKYVMSAHLGRENPGEEGWETAVSARISRAFFNVSMLHSLLRLYLLTDARTVLSFSTDAWDVGRTTMQPSPDPDISTRLQHWAASWKGRRAVIYSLHVLKSYENAPFSTPGHTMDPIAHMAAATAALTLRCWVKNNSELCKCGIVPGQPHEAFRLELEAEKETWAEEGGIVVLEDMPLCQCALDVWESRFVSALRKNAEDWEMLRTVLKTLSSQSKNGRDVAKEDTFRLHG